MARYSEAAQGMKLENGDIVSCFGVKGKVIGDVILIRSEAGLNVLVKVDFTRGTGAVNIMNLSDLEAVKNKRNEWVDLKGSPVAVN